MDPLLLWLRLSFEREVIRSNPGQLRQTPQWALITSMGCQRCVFDLMQIEPLAGMWPYGQMCREERAPECHMSGKVAARQPETHSENKLGVLMWSNFRDRHGRVDTERNFLSCGIIRKTTESFTGLLQQLKFNNGAADKIVELLVEKPNADARRFLAAHGENDRSGRVQWGCSAGQMAKKVFLIEWQRGMGFNKSAKSFHSLNPHFTEHAQLWRDVEELRADWR